MGIRTQQLNKKRVKFSIDEQVKLSVELRSRLLAEMPVTVLNREVLVTLKTASLYSYQRDYLDYDYNEQVNMRLLLPVSTLLLMHEGLYPAKYLFVTTLSDWLSLYKTTQWEGIAGQGEITLRFQHSHYQVESTCMILDILMARESGRLEETADNFSTNILPRLKVREYHDLDYLIDYLPVVTRPLERRILYYKLARDSPVLNASQRGSLLSHLYSHLVTARDLGDDEYSLVHYLLHEHSSD